MTGVCFTWNVHRSEQSGSGWAPRIVSVLRVPLTALALFSIAACSKGSPSPEGATGSLGSVGAQTARPLQPINASTVAADASATGYSCTFPGANGQNILARFVIDGVNARDDEGTTFAVLANSPTAVVLARARDDVASPGGEIGGYLIAIDRRDLSMVQAAVGVKTSTAARKGRCIVG